MAQQTAVQWLDRWFRDNPEATHEEGNKALEQASKMFEQQILDAFSEGASDGYWGEGDSNKEKYYNETYKQELTSQLPGINVNDVKPSNPQMVKENFSTKNK